MKTTAAVLVGVVHAAQPSFEEWQSHYGINSADEEMKAAYQSNVNLVDVFNAEHSGATFAVNQFSGMDFVDFQAKYLNLKPSNVSAFPTLEVSTELPRSVDWVQKGMVTPVKSQGGCGSCWAFGSNGAIESIYKQQTGRSINLSEQQLVDCTYEDGCGGGSIQDAFRYLADHSACTTRSYKYRGQSGSCKTGSCKPAGIALSGWNYVGASENALTSALQNSVVVTLVESTDRFSSYKSGILNDSANHGTVNHAVVAVGYAKNYFKLKNSWGPEWGDGGYVRISRNSGWEHGAFAVVAYTPMVPKVGRGASEPLPSPSPSPSPDPYYYYYYSSTNRKSRSMDEIDADVVV